jgi:RNA polymerase sigma-70 factor (ECF subfamily)
MAALTNEVTQLLIHWSNGDKAALDELIPLVQAELRRVARRHLAREHPGHTLRTSALINEAYLRLVDQDGVALQNRAHFFARDAQVMRHIPVGHARRCRYAKRGGGVRNKSLDKASVRLDRRTAEVVALNVALDTLAALDPRKGQIIELRLFARLTIDVTAEVMKISSPTVHREWRSARAGLRRELDKNTDG